MSDSQKSNRDLREVVNVFLSKAQPSGIASQERPNKVTKRVEPQIISFCAPFDEDETFCLNVYFPSLLSAYFKQRFLVTGFPDTHEQDLVKSYFYLPLLNPASDSPYAKQMLTLDYHWIFWTDKKQFFDGRSAEDPIDPDKKYFTDSSLIVVDLMRSKIQSIEHMIRILDQLVLVIKPDIEDLKNAYKIIKTCHYINRQIEISILFNADLSESKVENIFSKFTEIVSQFLVIPINCLGALSLPHIGNSVDQKSINQLNLNALLAAKSEKFKTNTVSLDKIKFLQRVSDCLENDL